MVKFWKFWKILSYLLVAKFEALLAECDLIATNAHTLDTIVIVPPFGQNGRTMKSVHIFRQVMTQ